MSKRPDVKELARKRLESSIGLQSKMLAGMGVSEEENDDTHEGTHISVHEGTFIDTQKETHIDVQNNTHQSEQQNSVQNHTHLGTQNSTQIGAQKETHESTQSGTHEGEIGKINPVAAFDAIFQTKQEERIERKTFVVRKDLLARFEALTKKKPRGFQTFFINYILEHALDEAEKEESN